MQSHDTVRVKLMFNPIASLLVALAVVASAQNIFAADMAPNANRGRPATPVEAITVLDGFKVELLRSAATGEGSWVSMTVDPQGRLIISPQGKEPMLRITLDAKGQIANIDTNAVPHISGAMGMLHAFDSLYVNGVGPQGYHLYRLRDTDGKGKYGEPELIRRWNRNAGGNGEHGAHGIVLGPDNKLYMVCGNFVDVPDDILPTSPHKNYADDLLLGRMEDGNGFGAGRKPPGGYVVRMDQDGKNAELFASGQRNTYDIAFNPDGELFGFDSDMEWDWGAPWYRPTRAYHIVSGGDQGFREGSGKYPTYYADSLPEVADIGIGSPVGVLFPTKAKLPAKFRNAFWMMDWSYGRILAVHLKADGSTYKGTYDTVLRGKPLNLTDMEVGPDGAIYFATGGRGTQSGLYRVSYVGSSAETEGRPGSAPFQARQLRHQLEAFHGKQDPKAVDFAWPHLKSDDRFIRWAARIAIESQPVDQWKQRALDERDSNASITALLALARLGPKEGQDQIMERLGKLQDLSESQKLDGLRVVEVSIARQGHPSDESTRGIIEKLDPAYPAKTWPMNREISQILIYLDAPGIVSKTLDLAAKAETQEEQLHYISALRKAKTWTLDERKRWFSWFANRSNDQNALIPASTKHPAQFEQWFADVGLKAGNGNSYANFIKKLKKEVADKLSENEKTELASLISDTPVNAVNPKPQREHKFVREWKMADFANDLNGPSRARNYANGREAFLASQCVQCHRLNNEGGGIGADLSGAGAKYTRRDILESILEPSKVISDQYQNVTVTQRDGDEVTGVVVEDTPSQLVLVVNGLTGQKVEVKKRDVKSRVPSKLSPMPEGLANILTKDEILDLIAYIESAGNKRHAAFKP